jgi:hypothetical protein
MLYMAASGDSGMTVLLGLGKENLEHVRVDDPLLARLSNVGQPGLFILYRSDDGLPSPRLTEVIAMIDETAKLAGFSIPLSCLGATSTQLDSLQSGEGCFVIYPQEDLPGIEKIIIVYDDDQAELVRKLKKAGVVAKDAAVTHIPRNILEN